MDSNHQFRLAALGIGGFDIANSFGTRVAQCFAYHRPGRIGRAVFTGTSIPHGTSPEERARTVEVRTRACDAPAEVQLGDCDDLNRPEG